MQSNRPSGLLVFARLSILMFLLIAEPVGAVEGHDEGAASSTEALRAEGIYAERCASCHDAAAGRIPPRGALAFIPPSVIVRALTSGGMKPMAAGLSEDEIHGLAVHMSYLPDRPPQSDPAPCPSQSKGPAWTLQTEDATGWASTSRDAENTRFQPTPGLSAEDVPKLKLAWALGIPGGASGPPIVSAGRLFISSGGGRILALDAKEGCTLWSVTHNRTVRTLVLGSALETGAGPLLFFGDDLGRAHAIDAVTGASRWITQVEDNPLNRVTAAPKIHDGRVYVAMSSIEDPLTHDPDYPCCTSRGSVTALDTKTGEIVWKQYTVSKAPILVSGAAGTRSARMGPAGGSIYTPVAIDTKRGAVYASTGEAYTAGDSPGAYSVIAFDMKTGERRWEQQFFPGPEERKKACVGLDETDCRNLFSMGTSVIVHSSQDGKKSKDILAVGQKWGFVYALDPDRGGKLVWKRRVGRGGALGGVMYGMADDGDALYVPISDLYVNPPHKPGDLVSLDPNDGAVRWRAKQPKPVCSWGDDDSCVGAQSAAPTVIPGVVFTAAWDGFVRAHSSRSGDLIWQFDTGREFDAINGKARGGQIAAYPTQVIDGVIYVTSGASSQARPGNALLVFEAAD